MKLQYHPQHTRDDEILRLAPLGLLAVAPEHLPDFAVTMARLMEDATEAARDAGYDEGRDAGFDDGKLQGMADGEEQGRKDAEAEREQEREAGPSADLAADFVEELRGYCGEAYCAGQRSRDEQVKQLEAELRRLKGPTKRRAPRKPAPPIAPGVHPGYTLATHPALRP